MMMDEHEAAPSVLLNYSNETLALLEQMAGAYLFLYRPEDESYYVSPTFTEKYFPAGAGGVQQNWVSLVFPADRQFAQTRMEKMNAPGAGWVETDCRMVDKTGTRVWVRVRARHFPGEQGKPPIILGCISELDMELRADAGTGLLNQLQFEADYENNFPEGDFGYLVLMGVDNFRSVNEHYGLHVGNQVLKKLADCLEKHASPYTRVYRLDGDRFATVLEDKNEIAASSLYTLAKKEFADACGQLISGLYCTISAGAAGYPGDSANFQELFQFAESALNTAKRKGKNNIVFFSRETYEDLILDAGIREALQQSVENGLEGFEVYYQPQISAQTGEVCGAEALLRWQHKLYGRVPPDVMVPILEEAGLIGQVGRWVLETAMQQCLHWRRLVPDFNMSVNLSYQQLEKEDVPGLVHAGLSKLDLPGSALTLELVESLQLRDFSRFNETSAFLNRMGVMMSIDDFGTGYSSLGYLKELDVHQIKVDRVFVSQIRESSYNYELMHFLIKLAHDSGSMVCVEGVETSEELEALLPLRADCYQGFYFGRPTDAADFEHRFLRGWRDRGKVLRDYYEAHQGEEAHLDKSQFAVSEATFLELLDELPELVMVGNRETHEILFLNSAGRTLLGAQNYKGMRCHQLLYDQNSPCPFCNDPPACRDRFVTREYVNKHIGGPFLMRHKLIPWEGKLANLGMSFTAARELVPQDEAATRMTENQVLSGCVRILAQEEDSEFALRMVLKSLGEYYQADRAYLFSFAENSDLAECSQEWLRAGVPPEKDTWINFAYSLHRPNFYALLQDGNPVVSGKGEVFSHNFPREYGEICASGQRWLLLAPIQWKGKLIGFAGVDNPERHSNDPQLLADVCVFLAQEFALNELREQLFRTRYVDSHTGLLNNDCYQKDMGSMFAQKADTPFGVVYLEVRGLKELNQQQGHTAGDLLLQRLAVALQETFGHACCRHYRTGADEMVVLCPDAKEKQFAQKCADLRQEGERLLPCTIRLGYAFQQEGADVRQLLETAYAAMQ